MNRPLATRAAAGSVVAVVLAGLAGALTRAPAVLEPFLWLAGAVIAAGCVVAVGTSLLHTLDTLGARFRVFRWRWFPAGTVDGGDDQDGDGRLSLSGDIASALTPGHFVYRLYDPQRVLLYVGKTGRDRPRALVERLLEHARDKRWASMIGGAHGVEWEAFPTPIDMTQAEQDQIRLLQPLHNQVRYNNGKVRR